MWPMQEFLHTCARKSLTMQASVVYDSADTRKHTVVFQGNHRMDCCYGPKGYMPRASRWGLKGLASCSIASQNMRCVQWTGSCDVRSFAWKSYTAILRAQVLKYGLVSRKEKNSRSVVFCFPKGNEAAEVALRGRLPTLRFKLMDRLKLY